MQVGDDRPSQWGMFNVAELGRSVYTDENVFIVQILANDPRSHSTEGVVVAGPARDLTLYDLESLTPKLRDECEWGLGFYEDLSKVGGGIGADGATILGLALGVVGAVPTVTSLFRRLRRDVPDCPQREEAWDTATWAVSLQYDSVERRALRLHSETRHPDHWSFSMFLPESRDEFEVDVFGSRSNVVATRVRWTNGDSWNRAPGLEDP